MDRRAVVAVGATVAIFLAVQVGALALVEPFKEAGYQTVENPQNPTNSLVYVGAILLATAVMLAALRFGVGGLIRGFVVLSAGVLAFYVFSVLVPAAFTVAGANGPALVLAGLLAVALLVYPEWYVIDAAGVVMGAGGAGLFGISFGLLPAILLLAVLAVYDAISVYGTEHMLTLASGVMELKVPVMLVIPLTASYSFLDAEPPAPNEDEEEETESDGAGDDEPGDETTEPFDRDAFFIGLGDAVMPSVLVASAAFFAPTELDLGVPGLALTVPALTAMVGTVLGLLVLMRMVAQGRAHAGLPLLNGGAILGYLAGALAAGVPLAEAVGLAPYL